MTIDELWGVLIDNELFTLSELQLISDINGYNMQTLNDAIYARYGYRDYEQMKDDEQNEGGYITWGVSSGAPLVIGDTLEERGYKMRQV